MKIFLSLLLTLVSCSSHKDEHHPIKESEILGMGEHAHPSIIPAVKPGDCAEYGLGCVKVINVLSSGVEARFVEFKRELFARQEALRLNAFYFSNWVFDDCVGEPVLEKAVMSAYPHAVKARLEPKVALSDQDKKDLEKQEKNEHLAKAAHAGPSVAPAGAAEGEGHAAPAPAASEHH